MRGKRYSLSSSRLQRFSGFLTAAFLYLILILLTLASRGHAIGAFQVPVTDSETHFTSCCLLSVPVFFRWICRSDGNAVCVCPGRGAAKLAPRL